MALSEELSDELSEELTVTFNPPLYLQRQIWVLDILRRENVLSVLDVGCGEGSLLQCLTEPSYSLPPTTSLPSTAPFVSGATAGHHADLHLRAVHGLDPCAGNVELAIQGTAPRPLDKPPFTGHDRWLRRNARWMRLEVSLWEGGFEAINEAFAGDQVDAFVASEVIEHLTPELLPLFAPILLGHYRPRLLLLTTPNYTYNQRFSPPGEPPPTGHPDPTGRTNRVFRHSDHKFEWTPDEWTAFCTESASRFGYAVEIGGVGRAVEPDPWNREDNLGYASQVALFRRLNPSAHQAGCLDHTNLAATPQLILRAKHVHETHPLSLEELALPPDLDKVREAVKEVMSEHSRGTLTFNELWSHGTISLRCKGDVGVLVRAFQATTLEPDTWLVENEAQAWETKITWKKFVATSILEPVETECTDAYASRLSDSLVDEDEDKVTDEWISTTEPFEQEDEGDDKNTESTNILWGAESGGGGSDWGWDDTSAEAWSSSRERPWSSSRPTVNES